MPTQDHSEYCYSDSRPAHTNAYLWNPAIRILNEYYPDSKCRVFDLGCGNGAFARHLKSLNHQVVGVDPSESGIEIAHRYDSDIQLEVGSAYDDLASKYGTYPVVISLEVVEHLYYPRKFVRSVYDLLTPNGIAIISTPYHGYCKNLILALIGKMDDHFTALWDHGHIKFWSIKTLSLLFNELGLECEKILKVGRIPILAKSMILVFRRKI